MPEHSRDQRHRHAVHHRVAGMRVTEIVKAAVLDAGLRMAAESRIQVLYRLLWAE